MDILQEKGVLTKRRTQEIDGRKIDAVTAMPSVLFGGSFVRCSYIYEGFHEKVASSKSLFQ